jgi:hypothetical protein
MLTAAASLAVALAASAAGAAAPPVTSLPPMRVIVRAASDLTPRLVRDLLAQADAVWRNTGVRFQWQAEDRRARATAQTPFGAPVLRVVIGHERHKISDERQFPLGWIVFDDSTTPEQEIYVSYENALALLESSPGVVGVVENMPLLKRELLLARAMGRALAHELGHYLSASKTHAPKGLMMAVHSAAEFFGMELNRFTLEAAERERIVARFTSIYMASRG